MASSLFAFIPTAVGLALVWTGSFVIKRTTFKGTTILFVLYACIVLLLGEVLLPMTPMRMWRTQRSMESVTVRNVRDQALLSARGNPIGLRIRFAATVRHFGPLSHQRANGHDRARDSLAAPFRPWIQPHDRVGSATPRSLRFARAASCIWGCCSICTPRFVVGWACQRGQGPTPDA
jgi:hypothetical protein